MDKLFRTHALGMAPRCPISQLESEQESDTTSHEEHEESSQSSGGVGVPGVLLLQDYINRSTQLKRDNLSPADRKKQRIIDWVRETLWRVIKFVSNPTMVAETSTIAVAVMKALFIKEIDRSGYWAVYGKYVNEGL